MPLSRTAGASAPGTAGWSCDNGRFDRDLFSFRFPSRTHIPCQLVNANLASIGNYKNFRITTARRTFRPFLSTILDLPPSFDLSAPYALSMTTHYPSLGHSICLSRFSKCRMLPSFVFFSLEALFLSLDSVIRSVSCYVLYLFLTCSARTVSHIQPTTDYLNTQAFPWGRLAAEMRMMLVYKTRFQSKVIHAVSNLTVNTEIAR